MKLLWLVLSGPLFLLLCACSGDDDGGVVSDDASTEVVPTAPMVTRTAVPGSPPQIRPAPNATLTSAGGVRIVGGIGTRCWGGVCLDYRGPVTNPTPVTLPAGQGFDVTFEIGPPTTRSESWWPLPAGAAPFSTGPEGAAWSLDPSLLQPVVPGASTSGLPAGQYLYVVQAFWEGQGDVMYGFWIDLR